MTTLPDAFCQKLRHLLGPHGTIEDADALAPFLTESRGRGAGQADMVALPQTTQEAMALVRLCHDFSIAMIPQGGNTGRVQGAQARTTQPSLVISLRRMNRIRAIDLENNTMTVEAGCLLHTLQEAADQHNRLFPLSLGAQGSCQIGGNIATNAGGIHVLRYGNTRALVLGLEVVRPDGSLWEGLRLLHKDNSGYDLKQLFIGSEGTLGLITAATLRLFPKPATAVSALVALRGQDKILPFFHHMQQALHEQLGAFELIARRAFAFLARHRPQSLPSLSTDQADWFILFEAAASDPLLRQRTEDALEQALNAGLLRDAILSHSEQQAAALWHMREEVVTVQRAEGASLKHDISVPPGLIPAFLTQAEQVVHARLPGTRIYCFGHVGDGNLHYNLSQPPDMPAEDFLNDHAQLTPALHDLVTRLGGSIAAEHGIGRLKASENKARKSATEWAMMHSIKRAFDPHNLMNPGCLFPESGDQNQ